MNGQQVHRKAHEDRTQRWSDGAVGARYGELSRLQRAGLIQAFRAQREGLTPEWVNYAVIEEGKRSPRVVLQDMLPSAVHHVGPFDRALAHSGPIEAAQLATLLRNRIGELRVRRDSLQHVLGIFSPWLSTAEADVIRHVLMRLDADLAWHESVIDRVRDISGESHGTRPGEQPKEDPS